MISEPPLTPGETLCTFHRSSLPADVSRSSFRSYQTKAVTRSCERCEKRIAEMTKEDVEQFVREATVIRPVARASRAR